MQYTMCHEVGHAFGLPHSDEDFENEDLGNCMDYSRNFEVSKHPDESNYNYLADLYGVAATRRDRNLLRGSKQEETTETTAQSSTSRVSNLNPLPPHLEQHMHEHVRRLERGLEDHEARHFGWRLLHRTHHGEEHELELGEGFKVRVHMLLANDDEDEPLN
jgi:hypothetical protein